LFKNGYQHEARQQILTVTMEPEPDASMVAVVIFVLNLLL
jgi:hypothetical protein